MSEKKLTDCRSDFPSLNRVINGRPAVYLDGPAGSQVPQSVIDAISDYYKTCNANTHGQFTTTHETDDLMAGVRSKVASFLNAPSGANISFGNNMTTLCYSLSRAIGRTLSPGDEVLITELDHEANRGPWLALKEFGAIVKEVKLLPNGTLDYDDFQKNINSRTKIVALGYASNLTGTVNNVELVRSMSNEVGALLVIDAVHYAPHYSVDVQKIDCDFLLCSAYKFYGPHVGILFAKDGALNELPTDRLSTQDQIAPYLIETGTLNHAAIAGVGAAINYLSSFGSGENLRDKLTQAMGKISDHEFMLGKKLYRGLTELPGIEIKGLNFDEANRTPTISFFKEGITAEDVCKRLNEHSIFGWDGHFYAEKAVEVFELLDKGGVTRLGISLYTTEEEIDHTLNVIKEM